jgi:hypothetical protein
MIVDEWMYSTRSSIIKYFSVYQTEKKSAKKKVE